MLIDKSELCSLIPHAGAMCLLGGVRAWDEDTITCIATSHFDTNNPLRHAGQLSSVQLLEYGAQAMAVHGALLARRAGKVQGSGYLASLQDVDLQLEFIDDITSPLEITAHRLAHAANCLMYRFSVSAHAAPLVSARATIFLHNLDETS